MFKYTKRSVLTVRPLRNCPKVRVRVKASYIGIPTYDNTVVATTTYRSERRSHPDPDSEYSGSGSSYSGSGLVNLDPIKVLPFKYEFIKIQDFYGKNVRIRTGSSGSGCRS
jgi:hypothetical protein